MNAKRKFKSIKFFGQRQGLLLNKVEKSPKETTGFVSPKKFKWKYYHILETSFNKIENNIKLNQN